MSTASNTARRRLLILGGLALLGVGLLGGLGLYGWHQLPVEGLRFSGHQHADTTALAELAGLDSVRALADVDPTLVADRVRRHPWVADARVLRLPTGTVSVAVTERTPVAVAIGRDGMPSHYLDAGGFQMPYRTGAAYHVPLVWGLPDAYHPVRPVQDAETRALLALLPTLPPEVDALVSDIERRGAGDWWLYTAPTPAQEALPVRLGAPPRAEQLERLRLFWEQAVLTQPSLRFRQIDLRFNSQVITQEANRP